MHMSQTYVLFTSMEYLKRKESDMNKIKNNDS